MLWGVAAWVAALLAQVLLIGSTNLSKAATWVIPAGGVDPGEDGPTAAVRETMEEVTSQSSRGAVQLSVAMVGQRTWRCLCRLVCWASLALASACSRWAFALRLRRCGSPACTPSLTQRLCDAAVRVAVFPPLCRCQDRVKNTRSEMYILHVDTELETWEEGLKGASVRVVASVAAAADACLRSGLRVALLRASRRLVN
jgi:hypothetical protein